MRLLIGSTNVAANKNPYDLRKECREEDQDALCYPQIQSIVEWLNATSTKLALGVDPALNFTATNLDVNAAFYRSGQAMLNSAALLVPLVNSGVRLMAYAGDVGMSPFPINLSFPFLSLTDRWVY